VGGGLPQVGILLVAIVIGLPCFFFTLLALLDHFERGLTSAPLADATAVRPVKAVQMSAATGSETDAEFIGASVVELPTPFNASSSPAAATG
jgi:hypothetical protein